MAKEIIDALENKKENKANYIITLKAELVVRDSSRKIK